MASGERHQRNEDGFTLIELMVVVLIIALLMAIAIPTFLGAQNRARDRSAQSDIRAALIAARTLATDHEGKFLSAPGVVLVAADLTAVEPTLLTTDTPPLPVGKAVGVLVTTPTGDSLELLRRSEAGTMFGAFATSDGRVKFCENPSSTLTAANCTGRSW